MAKNEETYFPKTLAVNVEEQQISFLAGYGYLASFCK